ncbi:MAG: lipopolysaccharide core heptose(I) kinase RfaP [Gammaproteobacteria bacterium]|nr:lipopolysaccharide core heptose(I) kinase RfaP [Gammaproteobacteria bacterium]
MNKEFKEIWRGADPYELLEAAEGKVYRQVESRRTFQTYLNGKSYFVKLHFGVGWSEIFKNIFQLKIPVISAKNEWEAINKLHELKISTMKAVAYGKKGLNPSTVKSFIVTEDLVDTISLEDFCRDWRTARPEFGLKAKLISKIARVSRVLHQNGVCHRDFYICHFLLHKPSLIDSQNPELFIIDLHRAFIKNRLGKRWIEKDIAGIFFSAMDIGLTRRDLFRFIRIYSGKSLRESLTIDAGFWHNVNRRAQSLYKKLSIT